MPEIEQITTDQEMDTKNIAVYRGQEKYKRNENNTFLRRTLITF